MLGQNQRFFWLKEFKTFDKIQNATYDELINIDGIGGDCCQFYNYLF